MLGLYYEQTIVDKLYYGPEECYPGIIYSEKAEVEHAHFCVMNILSGKFYDIEFYKEFVGDFKLKMRAFMKIVEKDTRDKITRVPRQNVQTEFHLSIDPLTGEILNIYNDYPFFKFNSGKDNYPEAVAEVKERNFTDKI